MGRKSNIDFLSLKYYRLFGILFSFLTSSLIFALCFSSSFNILFLFSLLILISVSAQNQSDSVLKVNGKPIEAKSIKKVNLDSIKIGNKIEQPKLDSNYDIAVYTMKEIYRKNPIVTVFFSIMLLVGIFKFLARIFKKKY